MELCVKERILISFGIVLHAGVNTRVAHLDGNAMTFSIF